MKILQVCQSFYPCFASGGVVRSAYELSKRLVEQGHDVTVYTTDGCTSRLTGNNHEPVDVEGIKVFYFKNISNALKLKFKISNPYYLPFRARKDLNDFDVIHIHEYRSFLSIPIHHYAKKYGIPYVLQAGGSVMPFFEKTLLKKFFDQLWGHDVLNDANLLLALTKHESMQYQKMGVPPEKIRIVPNGIDPSVCNPIHRNNFRNEYEIRDDEQIILYLGRLHKIKGIDLLVESFYKLTAELDNVRLVIAGPDDGVLGVLETLIEKHGLEDKVIFTGPLYDNKKFEAYLDADVYILPSRYEIFGNTVLEACACGTPVIVTDRCGISDFVEEFGFVVPFDINELEKAIKCILKSDYSFKSRKHLQNLLKSRFSLEEVSNKIEKIYTEIL